MCIQNYITFLADIMMKEILYLKGDKEGIYAIPYEERELNYTGQIMIILYKDKIILSYHLSPKG